jgi:hypothetical protein
MTITLPLQPQEEAAPIAMAEAKGLTVDDLIREALDRTLAERQPDAEQPLQTAADIVPARMRNVPTDIMDRMPPDGAS